MLRKVTKSGGNWLKTRKVTGKTQIGAPVLIGLNLALVINICFEIYH